MFHCPIVVPLPSLETRRSMGPGFKATSFERKIKLAVSIILKKRRARVSFIAGAILKDSFELDFKLLALGFITAWLVSWALTKASKFLLFARFWRLFDSCTASRYSKRYIVRAPPRHDDCFMFPCNLYLLVNFKTRKLQNFVDWLIALLNCLCLNYRV